MAVAGGSDWGPKNAWEKIQLSLTHEFGESGYRNLGPDQCRNGKIYLIRRRPESPSQPASR